MKLPDAFILDETPDLSELTFIGYTHTSILGIHRPDIAYPTRKIRPGKKSIGDIHTNPCPCTDDHMEVYVRNAP